MEVWIRSQSKQTLMKISKVYVEDKEVFAIGYTEFDERIGIYSTKERALEVLDEIQSIIRGKFATSIDIKLSLNSFKPEEIQNLLEQMAVYEMPEE